jgi:hypothetical protein
VSPNWVGFFGLGFFLEFWLASWLADEPPPTPGPPASNHESLSPFRKSNRSIRGIHLDRGRQSASQEGSELLGLE